MTRPKPEDDYKFPKWEFEQKFVATPSTGSLQPEPNIRRVGNLLFVGQPDAIDPSQTLPNNGNVIIYYLYDGVTPTLIGAIENPNPAENNNFGKAISVMMSPTGYVRALIVASNTRTYLYRRSEESFSWSGDGYPEFWGWAGFDGAFPMEELTTVAGGSVPGPASFYDNEDEYYTSTVKYTIPTVVIDPLTGLLTAESAVTKTALQLTAGKTNTVIEYNNGYAWAFTNTEYSDHHKLMITRIDYWHYDSNTYNSNEKLTYHYYFDNNTHTDPAIRTTLYTPRHTATINADMVSVAKWFDTLYVNVGDIYIYAVNVETGKIVERITAPEMLVGERQTCDGPEPITEQQSILSNLCVANGTLFFTSRQVTSSKQQRLWRYNLTSKTWDYTILPGRHQLRPRHIVDGLDGDIWITNYNNHSVIRANNSTGTIVATVRISRHPYQLMANQSKELFIASDCDNKKAPRKFYAPSMQEGITTTSTGAITGTGAAGYKVVITEDVSNGQINILYQNDNSTTAYAGGACKSEDLTIAPDGRFYDDGRGHLWFIDQNSFGRLTKSTLYLKVFYPQPEDATEEGGQWSDSSGTKYDASQLKEMIPDNATIDYDYANCRASVVTPLFTYEKWNGSALESTTVKPYLIWTSTGGTFNIVRLSALVRKSRYEHRATGMIAVGEQAYIGDGNL